MQYTKVRIFVRVGFFLVLFFCSQVLLTSAAASGLVINEIMYDPSGTDTSREWIEVRNTGTNDTDLDGHFFLSDGIGSSRHSLSPQGASVIPAGAYAVIVQDVSAFEADYPSYSGLIFDSSWSGLTASAGKTLAVIDAEGTVFDQVLYDPSIGATNDGNSLQQKDDGSWISASPTPGAANASAVPKVDDTDPSHETNTENPGTGSVPNTTTTSSNIAALPKTKTVPVAPPRMQANLVVPKSGVVGIAIAVSSKVLGFEGEQRTYGVSHFALGDGSAREGTGAEIFEHTYEYPGTYVITFEYRSYPYSRDPDITARAVIEVSASAVIVSKVNADGSIEISNKGKTEADLSGWAMQSVEGLSAGLAPFRVPSGTIILPGKSVTFPARVTSMAHATISEPLALLLPSGVVSVLYSDAIAAVPVSAAPSVRVAQSARAVESTPRVASVVESIAAIDYSPKEIPPLPPQKGKSLVPFVLAGIGVMAGSVIALLKFGVFRKISRGEAVPVAEIEKTVIKEEPTAETIRILDQ
jgi:hypothetical protein